MAVIVCVYEIRDHKNRIYIGSSVDYKKRKNAHLLALRKGSHSSKKLQSVFDKYGIEVLKFSVVEEVSDSSLLINREQHYIGILRPWFNSSPTAGSSLGVKHSDEVKRAQSLRRKGKPIHDENFKSKLAESNRNRVWSDEAKKKASDRMKGTKASPEWIDKIKKINTGRVFTLDHKAKIGAKSKGRPFTEKMRLAVIASNKNRSKSNFKLKENATNPVN